MPRRRPHPDGDLTIVIPLYNEAQALPYFVPNLIKVCRSKGWTVIFVDDGSRDETARLLTDFGKHPLVHVVRHKLNKGYGAAIKSGVSAAVTPYVLTMDGDGQHRLSDVAAIHELARKSDADLVIGSRNQAPHANWYRELGKWLIRMFTRFLVPLPIRDLNSGLKIYRTELVKRYLHLCPDSMAFSDVITLLFLNQRHLVLEYPIEVQPRVAGSSSISTQTAFETVIEVLNLVMLVNPLRIFLPLAFVCVLAGLLWGIPIMLLGRGVSVGSMLAIVLGALFFFLGLIASQLSHIRLSLARSGGTGTKQEAGS
ncbi:MAG TPA: glycosyltransferase family 2 protein [Anaerolineales bacterium]|nr:glycosyltransferase family 2 protein [Anaerolineales bacterium]